MRTLLCVISLIVSFLVCVKTQGQPPKIQFNPPDVDYFWDVSDGGERKYACLASGTEPINYSWKVKHLDSDSFIKVESKRYVKVENGVLTLETPTRLDQGVYQCVASNQFGAAVSKEFKLLRAAVDAFESSPTASQTAKIGEHIMIPCRNPPKSVPPAAFSWRQVSDLNKRDPQYIQLEGKRFITDMDGTLHIISVREGDYKLIAPDGYGGDQRLGDKAYRCGVYNRIVVSQLFGSGTYLTVTSEKAPPRPNAITYMNQPFTNKNRAVSSPNSTFTLQCIADGNPTIPDVGWKKDGVDIVVEWVHRITERPNSFHRTITISNVKTSDEGIYTCYLKNVFPAVERDVKVEVTSKPIAKILPESVILLEGSSHTFECDGYTANNHEPVKVSWYRGENQITGSRDRVIEQGSQLRYINVRKPADIDSLTCVLSNTQGKLYHGFTINIIDETKIEEARATIFNDTDKEKISVHFKAESPYLTIADPVNIRLKVKAAVDPLLSTNVTLIWKRDGVVITTKDKKAPVYIDSALRELVLQSSKNDSRLEEVYGNYTCHIDVGVPAAEKVVMISFGMLPTEAPIIIAAAGFPFWIIGLVLGLILLILIIILIICMMYRNRGAIWKVDEKERAAGNNIEKELADSGFHDLGRADGPEEKKKPVDQQSLSDDDPRLGEDTASLDEYGEPDMSKFNEEGSFIDMYGQTRNKTPSHNRPNSYQTPEDQQHLYNNVTPPPRYSQYPENNGNPHSYSNDTMV